MAETKKPAAKSVETKPAVTKKASAKKVAEKVVAPAPEIKKETSAPKAEVKKVPTKKATEKVVAPAPEVEKETPAPKAEVKKTPTKKVEKKVIQVTRFKKKYEEVVKKEMMVKFQYKSIMEVPALEKIIVNIGVGDATVDGKRLEQSVAELALITGQHPVITKAKKSIASFKLREGQAIGCKVTLRGKRMEEFYDKLISIALPRVRDFRGVSTNAFDGRGNYTLGIKEQLIFPEIDYDKVTKIRGMDIVIVTTAKTDKEAFELLSLLGMPFHR